MSKNKKKKSSKSDVQKSKLRKVQNTEEDQFFPDFDISNDEIVNAVTDLHREKPGLIEGFFGELESWRKEFVSKHGREPSENDLLEIFDEEDFEDLDDIDFENHQTPEICKTCAWCETEIDEDEEVFSFGIKSKVEVTPDEDSTKPLVITLSNGKSLNAIVSSMDSPARKEGHQLLVLCCSEKCVREAQETLQNEIDIDIKSTLN